MRYTLNQHRWKTHLLVVTVGWLFILISLAGFSGDTKPDLRPGEVQISKEEQTILQEQGFIVRPANYGTFYELYQELAASDRPILVTTDALLDATNTILDCMTLAVELQLQPKLRDLTQCLAEASRAQWASSSSDELKESALRNWAYFTIAQHLLGGTDEVPDQIAPWVNGELKLIQAHTGPAESPLFGYWEDYSVYNVRGSPPALLGYCQAMTWYERMTFRLRPGDTEEARAQGCLETLQALLVTYALKQNPQALEEWRQIYRVTSLLSGEADNLGVEDYIDLIDHVYGLLSSMEGLAENGKLEEFIEGAMDLKQAYLIPPWLAVDTSAPKEWKTSAPGFSLLGWRFSSDAYLFQELTYPNVGTSGRPRELPMGLDLVATWGSSAAETLLKQVGAFSFRHYDAQLERLQGELASREVSSLLGRWLNVLSPLFESPQAIETLQAVGSEAWQCKALQAGLAAWLERKRQPVFHPVTPAPPQDTASQAQSHGYVEPYPKLYAGLSSLVQDFAQELTNLGMVISQPLLEQLANLKGLLGQLEDISDRELAGEELRPDDYQLIQGIGLTLEELSRVPSPLAEGLDLHGEQVEVLPAVTGLYANYRGQKVLQGALGHVFTILALVEGTGGTQVAQGGVFSYYEFCRPLDQGLTEEVWQEEVAQGRVTLPWWAEQYVMQSYETVPFEIVDSGTFGGLTRRLEMVVRDEATWATLWKEHTSVIFPAPPLPQIDFNHTMIIVVSTGEQFTMGYAVTVAEVKQFAGELRLYYTIEAPGPECFVAQTLTQPFEIIELPWSEQFVNFVTRYEEDPCQ